MSMNIREEPPRGRLYREAAGSKAEIGSVEWELANRPYPLPGENLYQYLKRLGGPRVVLIAPRLQRNPPDQQPQLEVVKQAPGPRVTVRQDGAFAYNPEAQVRFLKSDALAKVRRLAEAGDERFGFDEDGNLVARKDGLGSNLDYEGKLRTYLAGGAEVAFEADDPSATFNDVWSRP